MGSPLRSANLETQLRPPTPPRRISLSDPPVTNAIESTIPSALHTPTSSPVPTTDAHTHERSKTVKWSPWTTYHPPNSDCPTPSPTRIPFKHSDKTPLKSILKPFRPGSAPSSPCHALGQSTSVSSHTSLPSMLASVIDALGGSDRGNKLDHYIMFSNSLRAYSSIPGLDEFALRIPVLLGFIKRDLEATMEDGSNPDSPIIQQAVKLLNIILWTPRLIASIDDRTVTWFLQHALQQIENPATSKYSTNLYLHLLANNKIPPRLMTTDRSARLISTLSTLDQRVQGKAIAKERIDIYIKLLHDARTTMQTKVAHWMPIVFRGLLSNVKEVRHRSLACMNETAQVLGGDKGVARCVTAIFGDKSSGRRMYEEIRQRLEVLAKTEHDGIFVARTWSAVLMVVQGRDRWEFFNPWLRIIEYCFNISERDVKVEAQMAWSKLICLVDVGNNTDRKLLHLLRKPLEQYLDPRYHLSNTLKPRKAAILNVIILLYYGLRPNVHFKHLSDIWEVVVVGLVENLMFSSQDEANDGCLILEGIFNGPSASTLWTDHRALNGPTLTPDDLPRLEPRWVRANCAQVLRTVEAALKVCHWDNRSKGSGFAVWSSFVGSLADAGKMEIKVSSELTQAVSDLLDFFQRVWKDGFSITNATPDPPPVSAMEIFGFLIESTIQALGPFCFVERQVSFNDSSVFSPVSTPRKPTSANDTVTRIPPVGHIFLMLLNPRSDMIGPDYFDRVRQVISKFVNSQDSRRKRLSILASFVRLLPGKAINDTVLRVWDILAVLSADSITKNPQDVSFAGGLAPANDFTDVQLLLDWGARQPVSKWDSLFSCLVETANKEYGSQEASDKLIKPVMESTIGCSYSTFDVEINRVISLVHALSVVMSKPDQHSAGKSVEPSQHKNGILGICHRVMGHCSNLLKTTYPCSNKEEIMDPVLRLFAALEKFLKICTFKEVQVLTDLHEGLGYWISDDAQYLSNKDGSISTVITAVWQNALRVGVSSPPHNSEMLHTLSGSFMLGFESRFRAVRLATVECWNSTFGLQPRLEYPTSLVPCLLEIQAMHNISLPTFPVEGEVIQKALPSQASDFSSAPCLTLLNASDLSSRSPSPTSRCQNRRLSVAASSGNLALTAKQSPSSLRKKTSTKVIRKRPTPAKIKQDRKTGRNAPSDKESAEPELPSSAPPESLQTSQPFSCRSLTKSGRPVSPISLDSDNESHTSAPVDTPVKPRGRSIFHDKPRLATPRRPSNIRDETPNKHSVDEMFVDVPESIERRTPETSLSLILEGDISPLKDVAELAREIPIRSPDPKTDSADKEAPARRSDDYPMSSPDAQIIAEVALAMPNLSAKKRTPRSRKRKRVSEPRSPPVLDTIVVDSRASSFNQSSDGSSVQRNLELPDRPSSRKKRSTRTNEPSVELSPRFITPDTCPRPPSSSVTCTTTDVAIIPRNTLVVGSPSPKRVPGSDGNVLQIISNIPKPNLIRADHLLTYPNADTNEQNAIALPDHTAIATVSPVAKAKESIRSILDMVEVSGMSLAETAALEDEMFEAFSKLRKRRQSMRL